MLEALFGRSGKNAAADCNLTQVHHGAMTAQYFPLQSGPCETGATGAPDPRHLSRMVDTTLKEQGNTLMKAQSLVLAALAAASVCAPSFAADTPSRTVDFKPSELSMADGREALEQRVQAAARQVCRQPGLRGIDRQNAEARCRTEALGEALDSVYGKEHARMHPQRQQGRVTLAGNQR